MGLTANNGVQGLCNDVAPTEKGGSGPGQGCGVAGRKRCVRVRGYAVESFIEGQWLPLEGCGVEGDDWGGPIERHIR